MVIFISEGLVFSPDCGITCELKYKILQQLQGHFVVLNHKQYLKWLPLMTAGLATAVLVAFHAWILWERILDASLFQFDIISKWAVAVVLLGIAFYLQRKGLSLFRGRHARYFWMFVLLIHFVGVEPLPDAVNSGLNFLQDFSINLVLPVETLSMITAILLVCLPGLFSHYPRDRCGLQWMPAEVRIPSQSRKHRPLFSRPPPTFYHN
jgi:hypothetical protein